MISTYSASIETTLGTIGVDRARIDVNQLLEGCAYKLAFYPEDSFFALATRKDDTGKRVYLLMAPCAQWRRDLEGDGFEIFQVIESPTKSPNPE